MGSKVWPAGSVRAARLSPGERLLRVLAVCVIRLVQRPLLVADPAGIAGGRRGDTAGERHSTLSEPTIFACRHVGYMDPVALMVMFRRTMIRPLVAMDYYDRSSLTRWFFRHAQCIPIDRRNVSRQWLDDALAALDRGESIIIFPEGRRNKSGEGLLPFHSGAALLASRSGARIVPVWNEVWDFPKRYHLALGEPLRLPAAPSERQGAAWIREQTAAIQSAVASARPE